jgi:hypothetical protein
MIYILHTSTQVTTGTTGPNYTLRFTTPTIINGIITSGTSCSIKADVDNFVNYINLYATGTSYNYTGTTNTGSKYDYPFNYTLLYCTGITSSLDTRYDTLINIPKYLNETIVYTGTTPTIVPSLTGKTFNFDTTGFTFQNQSNNTGYYYKYNSSYTVKLNNLSDPRDFEIYTRGITGGTLSSEFLIYSYTGTTSAYTIHDSTYFIL